MPTPTNPTVELINWDQYEQFQKDTYKNLGYTVPNSQPHPNKEVINYRQRTYPSNDLNKPWVHSTKILGKPAVFGPWQITEQVRPSKAKVAQNFHLGDVFHLEAHMEGYDITHADLYINNQYINTIKFTDIGFLFMWNPVFKIKEI